MDPHPIIVGPASDDARFVRTDHLAWFDEVGSLSVEQRLLGLPLRYAAEVPVQDGATYAGVYGVRPMDLSLPGPGGRGRLVPVAGLTWVGVHPDHRRRGLLTAMMRDHVARVREEGGSLSVLHASESAIYGRFGYGLAALELGVDLGRGTTVTAPHLEDLAAVTTTRLDTEAGPGVAERIRACDLRVADGAPGMIVGDADYYAAMARETPEDLRDHESWRVLFAVRDGVDVGSATFRREHKWDKGRPGGTVTVGRLHGDAAARLALVRRLVDLDLMSTTKIGRVGPDDPLFGWLGGPRGAGDVTTYDSTFVRLVDLASAWAARTYSADCDVVVAVRDAHAPWNHGTWRLLCSEEGPGTAQRVDAEPDLTLDVSVLGAAYLGLSTLGPALRAGLVREHRSGAGAALARAMRTDLAPEPSYGF